MRHLLLSSFLQHLLIAYRKPAPARLCLEACGGRYLVDPLAEVRPVARKKLLLLGLAHARPAFHLAERHREADRLAGDVADRAGELGVIMALAHALEPLRLAAPLLGERRGVLGGD